MTERTPSGPSSDRPAPTRAVAAGRRSGWRLGFSPLAATVAELAVPLLGRRGLVEGRLMIEWPLIVGEQLAARARPEKLASRQRGEDGAALQVRVASGAAALELQHAAPQVIERINRYFGFRVVGRLRLVRGPLPAILSAPPPPAPPPPLAPEAQAKVEAAIAGIEDPQLKQALAALGRRLYAGPARRGG